MSGRYSTDLPKDLLARFDRAESDPQLLDLRHELRVVDALLGQAAARLQGNVEPASQQFGAAWKRLSREIRKPADRRDEDLVRSLDQELTVIVASACDRAVAERRFLELVDRRRVLVEAQIRIEHSDAVSIPVREVLTIMSRVADVINRLITDRSLRQAIVVELASVVGLEPEGNDFQPSC